MLVRSLLRSGEGISNAASNWLVIAEVYSVKSVEECVMRIRQEHPHIVRVLTVRALAEIARTTDDPLLRASAILSLVDRRFLATAQASLDDLKRIEDMTDGEIQEVLRRSLN
jgi:hypothetical protein